MLEGLGTELGLANLLLLLVGGASVAVVFGRIKKVLNTDWDTVLNQHRKMWRAYQKKHLDDTGDLRRD